jgi:hypothetical protein
MIDISPVVDEDVWGGKRWLDGRPLIGEPLMRVFGRNLKEFILPAPLNICSKILIYF